MCTCTDRNRELWTPLYDSRQVIHTVITLTLSFSLCLCVSRSVKTAIHRIEMVEDTESKSPWTSGSQTKSGKMEVVFESDGMSEEKMVKDVLPYWSDHWPRLLGHW